MSVITLLFTDVVGSTELLRLGEDVAEEVRRAHFRLLRDSVARHGGEEVKSLGDGLMVAFTSTADAVSCAVAMQQAIDRRNRAGGDAPLGLRVGLDVGEPVRRDDDYFGTPVVVASRLCAAATGGQILASEVVRAIAASRGFGFKGLGALPLKGIDDPVPACEVVWEPAGSALPLPAAFLQAEAMPFVGREDDRGRLRDLLSVARAGRATLAMLAGEPGIGKTRLAGEFAREAHADGATVLYGRSDEEGLVPYQPFVEALGHYVSSVGPDDLARLAEHGADLVRLVPQVAELLPDLPPPVRGAPETERYRSFDAVAQLFAHAASEAPVVLVLDDLHWADKPTLLLLRHVLRTAAGASLLVLGTYRDVELDRKHPLADALADLRREAAHERMLLRGLSREEVHDFLVARAGQDLDPRAHALADALHRETEGNPFFIREIVRHLVEAGAIYRGADGRWTSDVTVEQAGLPEGVKEVIGRRLSRLSDACNEMLRVASVIGREFDLPLLAAVTGTGPDALLDVLQEAAGARVVTEAADAVDRYAFTHALMRETLYEELTTSRRVRLHLRIGEAIETLRGGLPEALAALAYHFGEAAVIGDPEKAIDYGARAGRRATETLAYEESAAHFERALQTLEHEGPADGPRRLGLLLELGEARHLAGDLKGSKEAYRRAADDARALRDDGALVRAALGYGGLWVEVGFADPYLEELIGECLERTVDDVTRARLFARLGMEIAFTADIERKRRLTEDAVALARRAQDPATLAYTLIARRHAVAGPADLGERLAIGEEAVGLATAAGDLEAAQRARALRMIDLIEAGMIDELDREHDEFARVNEVIRQPFYRYVAMILENERDLREGRLADADRRMPGLRRVAEQTGRMTATLAVSGEVFVLRWMQGRRDEDAEWAIRTQEGYADAGPIWTLTAAWARALFGDLDRARVLYETVIDTALRCRPTEWDFVLMVWGATELACRLDDRARMPALIDFIAPVRNLFLLAAVTAPVVSTAPGGFWVGKLAAALGRYDEAEEAFTDALVMAEHMRALTAATLVRIEHARMLVERGATADRERARTLLDRASEDAQRIGFVPALEDARALLAALP